MPSKSATRRYFFTLIVMSAVLLSAFSWRLDGGDKTNSSQQGDQDFSDIYPTYEWVRFFGDNRMDAVTDAVLDPAGNWVVLHDTYVLDAEDQPSQFKTFVTKINPNGTVFEEYPVLTSPVSYSDSLVIDEAGNYYISGSSEQSWGFSLDPFYQTGEDRLYDQFILKQDPEGNYSWNTFIRGRTGGYSGYLVLAPQEGIYVYGLAQGDAIGLFAGDAPFVAKYDSNGTLEWSNFMDGVSIGSYYGEEANGISQFAQADAQGNVIFVINSDDTWGNPLQPHHGLDDIFVVKYDRNGTLLWNTFLGGTGDDMPGMLYIAQDGSIYITGDSESGWGTPVRAYTDTNDGFVAKLDPNGTLLWNTFLGGEMGLDSVNSLAINTAGEIFLLGYSEHPWGEPIVSLEDSNFLAQIDPEGNLLWHSFIESPPDGYIQDLKMGADDMLYVYGVSKDVFGTPPNGGYGIDRGVVGAPSTNNQEGFLAKINLSGRPSTAYRSPGLFVPELTTHIPTPREISTNPADIATNLTLAALLMLPFAVAVEVFSRTLSDNEEKLSKFAPIAWISRMQKKVAGSTIGKLTNQKIRDISRLLSVALFYGLVFSLLDPTWNPISLQGLLLFVYMIIAFGLVGLLDDILQWTAIRKWGIEGEFSVRPTNVFLALASTTVSRILTLLPGLMFGSPEAVKVNEAALSEQQKHVLIRISMFTYLGVGLAAWLPTAFMDAPPDSVLGGIQAILLVIYAAALENTFVQLLGLSEGLGTRIKAWNKWAWVAALGSISFWFLHTLLDPTGDFQDDLQHGNTPLFIEVTIAFIVITFLLKLWQNYQSARRRNVPST
ncbi:MAG: hypothetical protein ACOYZ6_19865 [Chloroflexota bacterium]